MEKAPQFFEVEIDGPIIIWRFNNPPKNLWTVATGSEFTELVEAFFADPDQRVGIITSALPDVFIQHFDASLLANLSGNLRATATNQPAQRAAQRPAPRGIYRCGPKPVICAINGQVAGGGCELALACDFRYMSRKATIGLPEVNIGVLPGGGGTQRMPRLIGTAKALEMIMLGKVIGADEAERIGLVHRACDPEELMPAVLEFARELASRPPMAIAHIKRCIYEGSELSLEEGLALEGKLFRELLVSDDAFRLMSEYAAGGQDFERFLSQRPGQQ